MEVDYPCSHSMDTYWFAIDRDGHVACFSSGEAGAVPEEAFAGDPAYRARERLTTILPRCDELQDLQGRVHPGRMQGIAHLPDNIRLDDMPILMFLPSLEPVQAEIDAGRAAQAHAAEGVAVVWQGGMTRELFDQLHDAGACRGCFMFFEIEYDTPSPARHGIYDYHHLTENWISGPYGRQQVPSRPVHVDQLPPELRRAVKLMRFDDLRFADTPHIQPVEHAPCASWEPAYLDRTGKQIRPLPGKEADYAERYAELADSDRYQVEPPPENKSSGGGE